MLVLDRAVASANFGVRTAVPVQRDVGAEIPLRDQVNQFYTQIIYGACFEV
jgi:hypothetical protein